MRIRITPMPAVHDDCPFTGGDADECRLVLTLKATVCR